MVGIPKYDDDCTSRQKKVKDARVLVEVDATTDLVDRVDVMVENNREFQ